MHTIITGGTGLIGRALVASLVADDREVIVLSRNPDRATGLSGGVRIERWDARSAEGWGHLVNGAHAIVNLAGENLAGGRWTARRKRLIHDSRINVGQALIHAIQAATDKPDVVIQSSGIGYYGPRGDDKVTEDTPAGSDFLSRVAIDWENVTAPVEDMGVRRAIIRSSAVLSTQGGALPRWLLPFRLYVGGRLGSGQQWLPWIHIADEVRAIRFLMQHPEANGPFNLSAPHPLTNTDFSRALGRVIRRPALMPTPAFVLRLVLGEMATVLLEGQRAVPQRLLDLGFTFQFPQVEAALRDLLG